MLFSQRSKNDFLIHSSKKHVFLALLALSLLLFSSFVSFSSIVSTESSTTPQPSSFAPSLVPSPSSSPLQTLGQSLSSGASSLFGSFQQLLDIQPLGLSSISLDTSTIDYSQTPDTVVASLSTNHPVDTMYDPSTGDIYVSNGEQVSAIDHASNVMSQTIPLACASGMTYDPNNNEVFVEGCTSSNAAAVFVLSASSNTLITSIPIDAYFVNGPIIFNQADGNVYLDVYGAGSLDSNSAILNKDTVVINGASNSVQGYIGGIVDHAESMGVANGLVYQIVLNNAGEGVVEEVNSAGVVYQTGMPSCQAGTGNPADIAFDSKNDVLYASNPNCNEIVSLSSMNTISVANNPGGIVYDSDNNELYVIGDGYVSVVNPDSSSLVASIQVSTATGAVALNSDAQIAFDPTNGEIYLAPITSQASDTGSCYVTSIDGIDNTIASQIAVPCSVDDAFGGSQLGAYDAANGDIYYTDYNTNTVSAIFTGPLTLLMEQTSGTTKIGNSISTLATVYYSHIKNVELATGISPRAYILSASCGGSCPQMLASWFSSGKGTASVSAGPSGTQDDLEISTTDALSAGTYPVTLTASIQNGPSVSITYNLSVYGFKVKLVESGLPSGTSWAGTLDGKTATSGTNTLEFDNISACCFTNSNGYSISKTHKWNVEMPIPAGSGARYEPSAASGTIVLTGGDVEQDLTYSTQYQVSFIVNPSASGSTIPNGSSNWLDGGSPVAISSSPVKGYAFSSWSTSTSTLTVTSTATASTQLTVNGPGSVIANFFPTVSISLSSPAGAVAQGNAIATNATIVGGVQGVSLFASDLPSGATFQWSLNSVIASTTGVTTTLEISTLPSTPTGNYKIRVSGMGLNQQSSSVNYELTVISDTTTSLTLNSSTGKGIVTLSSSMGDFLDASAIAAPNVPSGFVAPFGSFSWAIAGLSPGQAVSLTLTFAYNVPTNAQYWSYVNGNWVSTSSLLSGNNGGNTPTISMTANSAGEIISDPSAVLLPLTTTVTQANSLQSTLGTGGSIIDVLFDPSNGLMYVENSYGFAQYDVNYVIYAVNPTTDHVVANVSIFNSFGPMAFDSSNGNLYTESSNGIVYVISTSTNTIIDQISLGSFSIGYNDIVFDTLNGDLYASTPNGLAIIDGSTNIVTGTITLPGTYAFPLAMTSDSANGDIYVSDGYGNIDVISGSTNTVKSQISLGNAPAAVVADPANGNLYACGNAGVDVVSTSSNAVIASISSAFCSPGNSLVPSGFNPSNGDVYFAMPTYLNTVSVISGATNSLVSNLNLPGFDEPIALAFDSSNGDMYIASIGILYQIASATNKIIGTVGFSTPSAMVFDPLNNEIYIGDIQDGTIAVLSDTTGNVIANIPLPVLYSFSGPYASALVYDTNNGNIYALDPGDNELHVIDTSTNAIIESISFGSDAIGPAGTTQLVYPSTSMAFDPSNGNIYIPNLCNSNGCGIGIVDGATNIFTGTIIPLSTAAAGLAYDSSNGYLYATAPGATGGCIGCLGEVLVVDTLTNKQITNVTVGFGPIALTFDPSNGDIYVANWGSGSDQGGCSYNGCFSEPLPGNTVSVISGSTNTVVATVQTDTLGPLSLVFASTNGDVYVAGENAPGLPAYVSVIDGSTNTVSTDIKSSTLAPSLQGAIVFDSSNGNIFVAGGPYAEYICNINQYCFALGSSLVSVISTVSSSSQSPLLPPIQYQVSFTEQGAGVYPIVDYTLSNGTSGSAIAPFTISIDASSQVSISYTYESIIPGDQGVRYLLAGTSAAGTVQVDNSMQITGTYKTQYLVTLSQNGLNSSNAQGTVVTIDGSQLNLASLPFSEYVDSGTTIDFSYSNIVSSSTAGERFYLTSIGGANSISNATITSPLSVVGSYETQFQVILPVNPSGSGSATTDPVDSNWYTAGSMSEIEAVPSAGYVFSSWNAEGSITVQDPSATLTNMTVNGPGSVEASFATTTYSVTFVQSGLPTSQSWTVTFNGVTETSTGNSITFSGLSLGSYSWTLSTPITTVQGTRYLASTPSGTMNVFSNSLESIAYITQYQVLITSDPSVGGSTMPAGANWHTAGIKININSTAAEGYIFQDWTSNTLEISLGNSHDQNTSATINGPGLVTAEFVPTGFTTTTVTCSSPVVVSQSSICSVTVANTSPGYKITPTGIVILSSTSSGNFNGACMLSGSSGLATCTVDFIPSDTNSLSGSGIASITALYNGDTYHKPSQGSTVITIYPRTTSISLSCSPSPVPVNAPTICTAVVSDSSSAGTPITPSGSVTFSNSGAGIFGSTDCKNVGATLVCTTSYIPNLGSEGTETLRAAYVGDFDSNGQIHLGSSNSFSLSVEPRSTSTSISCSADKIILNSYTTCTVTVTDTDVGTATTPFGSIILSATAGSLNLPSCNLSQGTYPVGTASCLVTYTGSSVNWNTISASYQGDRDHLSSVGTIKIQVIYTFSGFLPPLRNYGNYHAGSTIPVKFQLTDVNGNYIGSAVAQIYVDGKPSISSGSSNNGNYFRYDPSGNQYIFNLSTKGLSVGLHTITVTLDDGESYSIIVNIT